MVMLNGDDLPPRPRFTICAWPKYLSLPTCRPLIRMSLNQPLWLPRVGTTMASTAGGIGPYDTGHRNGSGVDSKALAR
jgi:hypothetical protein